MPATLTARFGMREPEPDLPPRETCAADAPGTAAFPNTLWRLVATDGPPVALAQVEAL